MIATGISSSLHWTLTNTMWSRCNHYHHLTDKEAETSGGQVPHPSSPARNRQSWGLSGHLPGSWILFAGSGDPQGIDDALDAGQALQRWWMASSQTHRKGLPILCLEPGHHMSEEWPETISFASRKGNGISQMQPWPAQAFSISLWTFAKRLQDNCFRNCSRIWSKIWYCCHSCTLYREEFH